MSIDLGFQVALYVPVANGAPEKRNGDFVFGVAVVDGGTLITVQWANGAQSQVEQAYLDKIIPTDGTGILGKVVKITDYDSSHYLGLVLMTYQRQLAGAGDQTPYALVKLISTGALMEVPSLLLTAQTNQ